MGSRTWMTGMVAGMTALAASSAMSSWYPSRLRVQAAASGQAHLRVFGGRSAQQRQGHALQALDGALADLQRHATPAMTRAAASNQSVLAGLHASSPAARFRLGADGATPLVAVDAVTTGDPQKLKRDLEALGLERAAVYANDVGGWLPVAQIGAAAVTPSLRSLRAALSRTRSGAVTSQGDFVQQSAALRSADSLTGAGITVGVLSDSFNCYAVYAAAGSGVPASGHAGYAPNGFLATAATDIATGDLPSAVDVLAEADCASYGQPVFTPDGDEGRAMLQIVHDVAPGAALAFYTAENSEADFANGITALTAAGAKVIADDVGYFDEPFYQDGLVAQAVDAAEARGVAYFSAAGNDGNASYENTSPTFATLATSGSMSGERLLNFDTSGATTTTSLPITLDKMDPGEFTAIVLEWDQPYVTGAPHSGGATSSIDVCVTGATGDYTIEDYDGNAVTCTGANALGVDPVQILIIANPANATASTPQQTLDLVIGLKSGPEPGRVKVAVETDGQVDPPITQFATNSATLQGHPGAAGAAAVAAAFYFQTSACGSAPAVAEAYSSQGGAPILFSATGARLATPMVRQKPDFTGPDGVNDTFLGFTLAAAQYTGSNGELSTAITACQNVPTYPNFFGTSAATPHVAGIAALMLEANPAATPVSIYGALRDSALPMGGAAGYDTVSGFGFVQAEAAIALLVPGAPTLGTTAATLVAGASTTITWSSVNATGCAAAGSWRGSLAASGTQTLTPGSAGNLTYTLTCSNAAGVSLPTSVVLTVTAATAAAPSHGGGGLDSTALLGLALLSLMRLGCGYPGRIRSSIPNRRAR